MKLSRFKSYSIKKVATLVNTPRFWILFSRDSRDTIAKTRFEPV